MSEKTAKATARDIRRAFGPDAVGVLNAHDEQLKRLRTGLEEQGKTLIALNKIREQQEEKIEHALRSHLSLPFRQRLRWVLQGTGPLFYQRLMKAPRG